MCHYSGHCFKECPCVKKTFTTCPYRVDDPSRCQRDHMEGRESNLHFQALRGKCSGCSQVASDAVGITFEEALNLRFFRPCNDNECTISDWERTYWVDFDPNADDMDFEAHFPRGHWQNWYGGDWDDSFRRASAWENPTLPGAPGKPPPPPEDPSPPRESEEDCLWMKTLKSTKRTRSF